MLAISCEATGPQKNSLTSPCRGRGILSRSSAYSSTWPLTVLVVWEGPLLNWKTMDMGYSLSIEMVKAKEIHT